MIYGIECIVSSKIPTSQKIDIKVDDIDIEFLHEYNYLAKVVIKKSIPISENNYPHSGKDEKGGMVIVIRRDLDIYNRFIEVIQQIESYFGYRYAMEKIFWENPKEFWIAENEEEEKKIVIKSNNWKKEYPPNNDRIESQLLANLLKHKGEPLEKYKIPMSFYREGKNYYSEFRYIDAYKYFYLCLESVYGKGKTKTGALVISFKESKMLNYFVGNVLVELSAYKEYHEDKLDALAKRLNVDNWKENIFYFIIKVRNFLNHHTMKCDLYGNPFDHERYHSMALLLMTVCTGCLSWEFSSATGGPRSKMS